MHPGQWYNNNNNIKVHHSSYQAADAHNNNNIIIIIIIIIIKIIFVVEKENNKAMTVDIASPWDHRVYKKEDEKIEIYQDVKREIGRLWGTGPLEVVPVVVGALGVVSNRLDA